MLVTLRIPVVDLRPFSQAGYPKDVKLPATWRENEEFVRYFGAVRKRLKGPVEPWDSERSYCQYDRVLRLPSCYPSLLAAAAPDLIFYGVERRLYPANTRDDLYHADLQIVGRSRHFTWPAGAPGRHYSPAVFDLAAVVKALLDVPTIVWWPRKIATVQSIGLLGRPIARAFDAATTVGGASGNIFAGSIALVIEVDAQDSVSARWHSQWNVGGDLTLLAKPVAFAGRTVNVFVISRPASVHRDRGRALRIHLLRLHAEREYLRRMARLLASPGFLEACDHGQVERIQDALNQCLSALTRARSSSFLTTEITTAFMADRTLSGSELDVLEERVGTFRPTITRRLRKLSQQDDGAEEQWRRFLERYPDVRNIVYIGEASVSNYDMRNSQIGAAGDHALATGFRFGEQLNLQAMSAADSEALQSSLRTLCRHLADRLLADSVLDVESEEITPTQIGQAIGALSEAEEAIASKDSPRAQSALRRCGRWVVSFAQQVGVALAAGAIQGVLHIP